VLTSALAAVAATWAVLMALGPVLQIRSIVRRRSSQGVSVGYFAILLVGFALWVAYGVASATVALVIPNTVAFVTALATIVVALRYRRGRTAREDDVRGRASGARDAGG
jgi:MtN3 and saliva related transmembrane protein